jgi:hypothetical protein
VREAIYHHPRRKQESSMSVSNAFARFILGLPAAGAVVIGALPVALEAYDGAGQ